TPARMLVDLAAVVHPAVLEDVIDDLWRRGLVTIERCLEVLDRVGRHRGSAQLRKLLEDRLGKRPSGSGRENAVRRLIIARGLPQPQRQYEIRSTRGTFIARPDLAYPDARLYIEFDSTKW